MTSHDRPPTSHDRETTGSPRGLVVPWFEGAELMLAGVFAQAWLGDEISDQPPEDEGTAGISIA